jgi:hypothetical protein
MIIGPDFVWLHFPKCGGTAVEKALHNIYKGRKDIHFDDLNPTNIIWHESINLRLKRDPSCNLLEKKIICCIRRLPHWLLSRVHFEASREKKFVATREMILRGQFYEMDGSINNADIYARMYSEPRVDYWIRTENIKEDLASAFDVKLSLVERNLKSVNETAIGYLKDLSFWFTRDEINALYEANPVWAAIEQRVYGSLLGEQNRQLMSTAE